MIFSALHLALTVHAVLRSLSERFMFGVVVGLVRAALMVVGLVISVQHAAVMLRGLTLRAGPGSGSSSLPFVASLVGPVLTAAVLWMAYKRFHDAPAAQEEQRRRPFNAWLPIGILDAIFVIILVGATAIASRTS